MSDRQRHALVGGIVAACVFGWTVPLAAAGEGQIVLRVRGGQASCNGQVEVPVELSDPNGLGALDVTIIYDPQALLFQEAEKARSLETAMLVHKAAEPGTVRCGLISARPIEREGVLFTLRFQARGQPGRTVVELANPQAWEARNAFVLRVAAEPGTLHLKKPLLGNVSPGWIAAGAGAIVALVLVFLLGRRSARRKSAKEGG